MGTITNAHDDDDNEDRANAGPPPAWDGQNMTFKDYKIKAKIWESTTRVKPRARGPLLLKALTGTPWEDFKQTRWSLFSGQRSFLCNMEP